MASAWMGMNQLGSLVNGRGVYLLIHFVPNENFVEERFFTLAAISIVDCSLNVFFSYWLLLRYIF
jgi:hypothetical protein